VNVTFDKAAADTATEHEIQGPPLPGVLVQDHAETVYPSDASEVEAHVDNANRIVLWVKNPEVKRSSLNGVVIKAIEVAGLSDAVRDDLLSRLPLHVGDSVSDSSLQAFEAAVQKFDEHLNWFNRMLPDGGVSIHIGAPGFEGPESIRK
jgi:hypothetical protein